VNFDLLLLDESLCIGLYGNIFTLKANVTGLGITTFGPESNLGFDQNFDNIGSVKPTYEGVTPVNTNIFLPTKK
jgi:hypothetical protein